MVNLIGSALSEAGKDHRLGSGDVLVLEMDMVKLGTHKRCVEEVMKKFGRVRHFFSLALCQCMYGIPSNV